MREVLLDMTGVKHPCQIARGMMTHMRIGISRLLSPPAPYQRGDDNRRSGGAHANGAGGSDHKRGSTRNLMAGQAEPGPFRADAPGRAKDIDERARVSHMFAASGGVAQMVRAAES